MDTGIKIKQFDQRQEKHCVKASETVENGKRSYKTARAVQSVVCWAALVLMCAGPLKALPPRAQSVGKQTIIREGIAVQLDVEPSKKKGPALMEGDDATLRLTLSYEATKTPLTGTRPAAWVNARREGDKTDCQRKVASFLSGSLMSRATIDLNSYYVLALNNDSTITVVDPLFHFGSTKLLALVALKSPGEDWALLSDQSRLFVSTPDSNRVAVVDAAAWKIAASIDVAPRPSRIALQPDERYLWVSYGDQASASNESGVAVINTTDFKIAARIPTGRGRHEIAFSDDSRFAFVTNGDEATVSVIDAKGLKKIKDIGVGRKPASIAFSSKAQFAYVTSREDGVITVIDGARQKVIATMQAHAGLGQIKFSPNARLGFAVNPDKNAVYIFDVSNNRIIQTANIPNQPDQLAFTSTVAYVRSRASEFVYMMPLDQFGPAGKTVSVVDFPGGQAAFFKGSRASSADTIVKAPDTDAVLVANPADKTIYYYKQGMAAPMGNFNNYKREPRAVLVVDRSLRERAPGVYETTVKLPQAGTYDVAFILEAPRIVHCFEVTVDASPELAAARRASAVKVEPMVSERKVRVGQSTRLRLRVTDPATGAAKEAKDILSLVFLAPGTWQTRQWAKPIGEGVYEIEFTPPETGVYYVFIASQSLGLAFNKNQLAIIEAHAAQ
jgi:YVTN family beta-propeller protein